MNKDIVQDHQEAIQGLIKNLNGVIVGKEGVVRQVVAALLSSGNILLEDVPGVGKTTLAKALARSLGTNCKRVQFTPDLLPSDILGASIYNPADSSFEFREGPIFTNVLLADEINRASPRTQSALLEAMTERQSTVEGIAHKLPQPFMVIATQNPIENQGTYPLPEAQLDRFMVQIHLGYPDYDFEFQMLRQQQNANPVDELQEVMQLDKLISIQESVKNVFIDDKVLGYLLQIIRGTREDQRIELAASPRAGLMLMRIAQATAYMNGRSHVIPDDVRDIAVATLGHRILCHASAGSQSEAAQEAILDILSSTPIPK
ncbi:MAG: MoxR family ATPase [Lentisphaeria bacterium]|nr:MoxR family ATPase [Lentisphaeria bacterium]